MIDENDLQMRGYIVLAEKLQRVADAPDSEPAPAEEAPTEPATAEDVVAEVEDLIFKLEAHSEAEDGDYGLGIETGMQRAAEMLTNMVRRLRGET